MPRTEEANQRIREEQRAKILESALAVFARKGMEATIAEVAAAADVSYGLVYRYFVSKEVLLAELLEKVLSDSLRALEHALEIASSPGERLRSLLTQILNGVREHPEFILLIQHMLAEEAQHAHAPESGQKAKPLHQPAAHQEPHNEAAHTRLRQLAQEQSKTYRAILKQLIVEGQATSEIANDDPDQLVAAITACVTGLSQAATWQPPEQFKKNFPDTAIILRMLIPQQKENTNA